MAYNESDFQSAFTRYLKNNWEGGNVAFELKICKEKSLPFNKVEEHQIHYLLQAKHNKVVWKISDMDMRTKPFDCFVLTKCKAYVTVLYYEQRKPKLACCIDIDDFVNEMNTSPRKSLTKERAIELSNELITI